jgi:hypothetical protein
MRNLRTASGRAELDAAVAAALTADPQILFTHTLGYMSSAPGASTVFTQPGEFIDMLRNASVAVGLGARVMSGLTGPVSFPTQTGGVSVSWVAENSGTDVTATNATLSSVSLSPKTLQGSTAFSRQLMAQSSLDVEAFIRGDPVITDVTGSFPTINGVKYQAMAIDHGYGDGKFPDGEYDIVVKYLLNNTAQQYQFRTKPLFISQVECCITQLVADVEDQCCGPETQKYKDMKDGVIKLRGLVAAQGCGKTNRAIELLKELKLICQRNPCKTC